MVGFQNVGDHNGGEMEKIDDERGDGVREGDKEKSNDGFGKGVGERGGGLRIDFLAEHNTEADADEDEDEEEVGEVAENFPDL